MFVGKQQRMAALGRVQPQWGVGRVRKGFKVAGLLPDGLDVMTASAPARVDLCPRQPLRVQHMAGPEGSAFADLTAAAAA